MFRRRSTPPPYEVMGGSQRAGAGVPHRPGTGAPQRPTPSAAAPIRPPAGTSTGTPGIPGAAGPSPVQDWVAGAKRPVVIRIPRAGILLAALVLVVLLFAAYWVGRDRGLKQADDHAQDQNQNQQNERNAALQNLGAQARSPAGKPAARPLTGSGKTSSGKTPPGPAPTPGSGTATPSRPQNGLYYFVLATTNQQGAEKLVQFLRDNQVDAAAVSRNNGRSFQVMALRGFTRDEVKALAYRDYEKQLHAVGRRWANASRGNKDLSDMYIPAEPYQGEPTPAPPANRTKPR